LTAKTTVTAEKQSSSSLQKSLMIADPAIQVPLRPFSTKGILVDFIFYFPLIFLLFLTDIISWLLLVFAGIEENIRKHSSSYLSRFNLIYNHKTTILSMLSRKGSTKKSNLSLRLQMNLKSWSVT
jgi:hypothetical protein